MYSLKRTECFSNKNKGNKYLTLQNMSEGENTSSNIKIKAHSEIFMNTENSNSLVLIITLLPDDKKFPGEAGRSSALCPSRSIVLKRHCGINSNKLDCIGRREQVSLLVLI